MNKKKLHQLNIIVVIVLASMLAFLFIFSFLVRQDKGERFRLSSMSEYSDGWVLKQHRGNEDRLITLPEKVAADEGEIICIMNRVPEDVNSSSVIMLDTNFQNIIVLVDDEEVYRRGVLSGQALLKNVVPCTNIIDIGSAKPGDIIAIYLESGYKGYGGRLPQIYYGTRGDAIAQLIRGNIVPFVLSVVLLAASVILMVSLLILKKLKLNKLQTVYALGFTAAAALWLIMDNTLVQFFTGRLFVVYMLATMLLMLLPILYCMYQRTFEVQKRYADIMEYGMYAYCLNFVVGIMLQMTSILDFSKYMIFTKVLIYLGMVALTVMTYLASETVSGRELLSGFRANAILLVAMTLEAVLSLFDFYAYFDGMVLVIGIFVFVIMLMYSAEGKVVSQVREEKKRARSGIRLERSLLSGKLNTGMIFEGLNNIISDLKETDMDSSRGVYDISVYLKHNVASVSEEGLVDFEQELEYIKSYLAVAGRNYPSLQYEVEDKITEFRVPYSSVEALVENSVVNGALCAGRNARIVIRSYERIDCYAIQIVDNGPGVSPKDKFTGRSGFDEIRGRLRAMCGAAVEVKTRSEGGTIVTVKVPKEGYIIKE